MAVTRGQAYPIIVGGGVVLALEVLVVLQLGQIVPAQTEQMVVEAVAVAVQFLVVDNQTAATAATA
jgi:hypothetical protein